MVGNELMVIILLESFTHARGGTSHTTVIGFTQDELDPGWRIKRINIEHGCENFPLVTAFDILLVSPVL